MISGGPGRWSDRFTDAGHLALDAVVAFVDGELPPGPAHRAAAHVDRCVSCAAEVAAQRQARRRVRAAGGPAVPSSLYDALCSIPDAAPLPGLPAGLAAGPDGELVVPAEAGGQTRRTRRRDRRRALGVPVALSSGVVVGAAALAALTGPVVVAGTPAPAPSGSATPVAVRTLPTAAAADLSVRDGADTEPGPRGPGAP